MKAKLEILVEQVFEASNFWKVIEFLEVLKTTSIENVQLYSICTYVFFSTVNMY